jgi:hypothetical protein
MLLTRFRGDQVFGLTFTEDERFNYLVLKKKKPLNPLEHRLSQSRCGRAAFLG